MTTDLERLAEERDTARELCRDALAARDRALACEAAALSLLAEWRERVAEAGAIEREEAAQRIEDLATRWKAVYGVGLKPGVLEALSAAANTVRAGKMITEVCAVVAPAPPAGEPSTFGGHAADGGPMPDNEHTRALMDAAARATVMPAPADPEVTK